MKTRPALLVFLFVIMLTGPQAADACIFGCLRHHCDHHRSQRYSSPASSTATPSNFVTIDATRLIERLLDRVEKKIDGRDPKVDAKSGGIEGRIKNLETQLGEFESNLNARLANIDKAIETLSKRQEETVGELESRINANNELITSNATLVLGNAKEIQRLVRLASLAPTHRVKSGTPEDNRRTYLAAIDLGKKDDEHVPLEEMQQVRVSTEKKEKDGVTYVKVKYVNRSKGVVSQKHFIRESVLESLH